MALIFIPLVALGFIISFVALIINYKSDRPVATKSAAKAYRNVTIKAQGPEVISNRRYKF